MSDQEETFQQEIDLLSKRSSQYHAYPRPDFDNLNTYLSEISSHRSLNTSLYVGTRSTGTTSAEDFAVLLHLASHDRKAFAATPTGAAAFARHTAAQGSSILFMRGFASPKWISAIGEKQRCSPEFCRRHFNFQAFASGGRDLYSSPSLPSSSARIFQLTVPTICARNIGISGHEPEDLQQSWRLETEAMNKYFQQLRTRAKVGDSIVRNCLLLSKEEYVLEQTITVEVGPSQLPHESWRVFVWLDSGKDISESLEGPWSPRPGTRAWETYFLPVIVHQATEFTARASTDAALLIPSDGPAKLGQASRENPDPDEAWRAAQNITLLPFYYGSHLDKNIAQVDALYALSELFQFVASAEVQFLNLLDKRIAHELSFVGVDSGMYHSVSLLNLTYINMQLKKHAQNLTDTIGILRNRDALDWPRANQCDHAEQTAVLLLVDFEYLLHRAETLARECEQGMDTLANSSVLEEARRSTELNMVVHRLTIIGTIFIPLSFVCSAWGMNFEEMGSGSQPMWMLAATIGPVVLFAYAVYRWDAAKRLYRRTITKSRTRI
ncbi:hypothetical protein VTL71DRAFT_13263 [Oculimacula yallundae]|uniref:Uncharacterized protein n=1 Tax=Oculimacula yallundae TaxID=86028 RepID=A0ABR4CJV0_9HELO